MSDTQPGKWEKCFIYDTPGNFFHPETKDAATGAGFVTTLFVNDELNQTLPNAFYFESNLNWGLPTTWERSHNAGEKPHTHLFDEYMLFQGTDPNDPFDLGAEVEFWIEDYKHIITRTCLVFIPANVMHCPIAFHRIDRPFVWVTTANSFRYRHAEFSTDPKLDDIDQYDDEAVGAPPVVSLLLPHKI
jgi:hypothetical protein